MKRDFIEEVAETLQMVSDDFRYHYNMKTGEFLCVMPDYMSEAELDDLEEHWGDYIPLPTQYEINEYEMMADFACQYPDETIGERLCDALRGRGAFRRFKDTVYRLGICEIWFAFRDVRYYMLAKEWCEEHNLLAD